jgi:plasmid stability protein
MKGRTSRMQNTPDRMHARYPDDVGTTVQIRNLSDDVTQKLKAHAAAAGLSLSEYLRRELTELAEQIDLDNRWDAIAIPGFSMPRDEILDAIHADRKWED